MKTLFLRLIIPLTIISFAFITKWWYTLPEDAPDTMYTGFPLAYSGAAWHTSLAYQIFLAEFLIDLFMYFLFWSILIYCIDRFWFTIKPSRKIAITGWSLSIVVIGFYALYATMGDNVYYFKRPYPMKVMESGYEFFWQHTQRP